MLWQQKLQTETPVSTMEADIIALDHCYRSLFLIMDSTNFHVEAVGLLIGDTTMNVSIHENNYG